MSNSAASSLGCMALQSSSNDIVIGEKKVKTDAPKKGRFPQPNAGAALAAIRWEGHARAEWKPIKIKGVTLAQLKTLGRELGGLTLDATVCSLIDFRSRTLESDRRRPVTPSKTTLKKHD